MSAGRFFAASLFFVVSLLGLATALWATDEGYAILTERDPTISVIVASRIVMAPRLSIAIIFAVGVLVGALIAHFTAWLP